MLIIDSHLDLSWNALQWNRDLRQSVYTIRGREGALKGATPTAGMAQGTVALPEMRQGRMALCCATLLARCTGHAVPDLDYASLSQAYAAAQGQLAYYRALAVEGEIRVIADRRTLDSHMAEWEAADATGCAAECSRLPLGFVISMESADPIPSPAHLEDWYVAGVRVIGPAHYGPGRYAGGTSTESGLTDLGIGLLAEMQRLGIILDLTHFSDTAFWQALERYTGPVLASHNNCRMLVPHQRQFSDDQLRAIFSHGGVIGVAFDAWMLRPGWVAGQSSWLPGGPRREPVLLAHVVDHIDHICQLAGTSRHVGIGSDLDGGYGRDQSPADLDTIADLQKLQDLLAKRGYAMPDISAILYGNWVALLRQAWS